MSFIDGETNDPMAVMRRSWNWLLPGGAAPAPPPAPPTLFFFANQGPKFPLNTPVPPALIGNVQTAFDDFQTNLVQLGVMECEGSTVPAFNYTGGAATVTGGPVTNVSNFVADFTVGRYNMTPLANPFTTAGRYLETSQSFSYNFSLPIQCIGFFVTDLGDFDASIVLNFYSAAVLLETFTLTPTITGNGTLSFFGAALSAPFDQLEFVITQINPGSPDFIGFDRIFVGQRAV